MRGDEALKGSAGERPGAVRVPVGWHLRQPQPFLLRQYPGGGLNGEGVKAYRYECDRSPRQGQVAEGTLRPVQVARGEAVGVPTM